MSLHTKNHEETKGGTRRQTTASPAKTGEQGGENILQTWRNLAFHRVRRFRLRWSHVLHGARKHTFPESDQLIFQLALLVWGMLMTGGCVLREKVRTRRSWALRRSYGGGFHVGRRFVPVAVLLLGCVGIAGLTAGSMYTKATTVLYDGEVIAVVASEEEVESARKNLEKTTTRALGERFTMDQSLLQYSTGWVMKEDVVGDRESLEADLSEELGLVTTAYALYVDGERIGATPYEGALEELLEQLQSAVTNENTVSCSFAEDVEIREELVPNGSTINLGYIAEKLYSTKTEEVTYEVKKGDTWSRIAADHDMTTKELEALNPGYDINKLQIGEILTLSASVPYLTVTVVQQERYVDDVMYDIVYAQDANMYVSDERVDSKGVYGAADVVANVTYVNGEQTARTVISSVTLKEPVTEYRTQGTKPVPTWYPTGSFRWPTTGRISSTFGGRKSPGGIGSTNHKGLDIANKKGTAIYAADGGTVTYAGWMGGYGYTVKIKHNGTAYETLYAHNSKLLVSVGDKVYKGQQIAKMGTTGNSTGNHCHFEIRYNGVAKNPMNYLP